MTSSPLWIVPPGTDPERARDLRRLLEKALALDDPGVPVYCAEPDGDSRIWFRYSGEDGFAALPPARGPADSLEFQEPSASDVRDSSDDSDVAYSFDSPSFGDASCAGLPFEALPGSVLLFIEPGEGEAWPGEVAADFGERGISVRALYPCDYSAPWPALVRTCARGLVPFDSHVEWRALEYSEADALRLYTRHIGLSILDRWTREASDETLASIAGNLIDSRFPVAARKGVTEFLERLGQPKETSYHLVGSLSPILEESRPAELHARLLDAYSKVAGEEIEVSAANMAQRAKAYLADLNGALGSDLLALARDPRAGLAAAGSLAGTLADRAAKFMTELNGAAAAHERDSAAAKGSFDIALEELAKITRGPLVFFRRGKVRDAFHSACKAAQRLFEVKLLTARARLAADLFSKLSESLKRCEQGLGKTQALRDAFLRSLRGRSTEQAPGTILLVSEERAQLLLESSGQDLEGMAGEAVERMARLLPDRLSDLAEDRSFAGFRKSVVSLTEKIASEKAAPMAAHSAAWVFAALCSAGESPGDLLSPAMNGMRIDEGMVTAAAVPWVEEEAEARGFLIEALASYGGIDEAHVLPGAPSEILLLRFTRAQYS